MRGYAKQLMIGYAIVVVVVYGQINKMNMKYQGTEPLICEVIEDVEKLCLILELYSDPDLDKSGNEENLFLEPAVSDNSK